MGRAAAPGSDGRSPPPRRRSAVRSSSASRASTGPTGAPRRSDASKRVGDRTQEWRGPRRVVEGGVEARPRARTHAAPRRAAQRSRAATIAPRPRLRGRACTRRPPRPRGDRARPGGHGRGRRRRLVSAAGSPNDRATRPTIPVRSCSRDARDHLRRVRMPCRRRSRARRAVASVATRCHRNHASRAPCDRSCREDAPHTSQHPERHRRRRHAADLRMRRIHRAASPSKAKPTTRQTRPDAGVDRAC